MQKKLVAVLGPTAVGKTSLSIRLADHFDTEILSADSRQFYKEMSIGTAKPTAKELNQAPHHFINMLSIREKYTAGQYEEDAIRLLELLFKKHNFVILTGGSGLYVNAVCHGIDELPKANKTIRFELEQKLNKEGVSSLQKQLKELDPDYYTEADIHNPRRLIRAIEVSLITGKPYSSLRKATKKNRPFQTIKIGLKLEREVLYKRINQRVDQMVEQGLVEEAKNLINHQDLPALQTVGYSELFNYFKGGWDLETAIDKIKTNTRRYAKRQLTWLRKDEEIKWFEPNQVSEIINYVEKTLS